MCKIYSESGAPIAAARCADFLLLQSDRDRLAGVVDGMGEQNARNLDALRRAEGRDQGYAATILELMGQRDALKQERDDYQVAARLAETKETAVHIALNKMRQERDALLAQLADHHAAVQHVTEDGKTTRSYTGDGWAMIHAERLRELEAAEEERNQCRAQLEKADALADIRAALCEYQLKYWTLAYKTAMFSRMMFGDLDDEDWSDEVGGGE